jgi:Rad3-related DNA helicase
MSIGDFSRAGVKSLIFTSGTLSPISSFAEDFQM